MPSHRYSKKAQKVEELRLQLCKLRDELDELRKDVLWESWIAPSRFGITLIITSLHLAEEEIEKHYLRWLSKTYEVLDRNGIKIKQIIVDNELEAKGYSPLDVFVIDSFGISWENAKKNHEFYSKLFSCIQIKNKRLD